MMRITATPVITRLLLPWLALQFAVACASAPGPGGTLLLSTSWARPLAQTCELLSAPMPLPTADQLLDVDAARALLTDVALDNEREPPYTVLEVRFDSAGARQPVRVVENTLAGDIAESLSAGVVARAPAGMPASGQPWGVLLKATAGAGAASFDVGRMEFCASALINRAEFTRLLGSSVQQLQMLPALDGTRQALVLDVFTDSDGRMTERRLHESTGYVQIDRLVLELADQLRIAPPLLNRRPLAMWTRLPIDFAIRP